MQRHRPNVKIWNYWGPRTTPKVYKLTPMIITKRECFDILNRLFSAVSFAAPRDCRAVLRQFLELLPRGGSGDGGWAAAAVAAGPAVGWWGPGWRLWRRDVLWGDARDDRSSVTDRSRINGRVVWYADLGDIPHEHRLEYYTGKVSVVFYFIFLLFVVHENSSDI